MKPVGVLIAVVSLGVALSAVSLLSRSNPLVSETPVPAVPKNVPDEPKKENPLTIAKSGPQPKAVLENGMHEFGSMELGQKLSHEYVVRNDGEAPLLLKKGTVQCKCTVPTTPEEPIAPGKSVKILLEWEPASAAEEFHQMAQIWTNDPEHQELELHVKGKVERMFYVMPAGEWQVNKYGDDQPMKFEGMIVSPLVDAFQIVDHSATSDKINVEFEPLAGPELEEVQAKSGYRVKGTVTGDVPIGKFRETLTVSTDMAGGRDLAVHVAGFFPGPFSILGQNWVGAQMRVKLGEVKVSDGKSVTLSMFTHREDEPMQFDVKETKPGFLHFDVKRDESFTAPTREKYNLTFSVPPGAPQGSWQGDDVASIRLGTNREDAPEFELYVEMVVRE
ncbi:MAG: DUF1573 domain-containing protein [Planctomycetaceae bacterium]